MEGEEYNFRCSSKTGVSLHKQAEKRRDQAVSMRVKRKEDRIKDKRSKGGDYVSVTDRNQSELMEQFQTLAENLYYGDDRRQLDAAMLFRRILSDPVNPPITEVILTQPRPIPRLVEFLDRYSDPLLQFEAAWALTNIAAGKPEHTLELETHSALPKFVALLSSTSPDIREQAVWALGNVAGDSTKLRDRVLDLGALPPLIKIIHENPSESTLNNSTWTLSNLLRGKPAPMFEKIMPALPSLANLIHHESQMVQADAMWALSYASDGANEKIAEVVKHRVVPRIIELLNPDYSRVLLPSLRTLGNIVTGTEQQTQMVIDAGLLPSLYKLLMIKHNKRILKECCWAISNITAGTVEQIQAVIDAKLVPILVLAIKEAEIDVKQEAIWAVTNLAEGGTAEQILYLTQQGCLPHMIALVRHLREQKLIIGILDGLENIIEKGADLQKPYGLDENPYIKLMIDTGIGEALLVLQHHGSKEVYEKAAEMMVHHFNGEPDSMDMQPATQPSSPYVSPPVEHSF